MVKAVKLWHFATVSNISLETFVSNLVSLLALVFQMLSKTQDGSIFDFHISGQSLINENWPNSRTSDDIDMKLGMVTKLDKKNKTLSKNDDDVMSANCDVIVIFPIFGQFGAIRKPDSERIVCKTYIFINSNLLSYRNWKTALKNL